MDHTITLKFYKLPVDIFLHAFFFFLMSYIFVLFFLNELFWSALATAPAETSAEAKEAFTFNKIFSFH
jgi:hypothetical protein